MKRLGVITGMAMEARTLRRAARLERLEDRVLIAPSGGHADRISEIVAEFAEHGAGIILSMGLAGGLKEGLKSSALILPANIVFDDGSRLAASPEVMARISEAAGSETFAKGNLFCAQSEVTSVAEKMRLAAETGAIAVDMESGHAARAAHALGLEFAALRVILDGAGEALPEAIIGLLTADGKPDRGKLLRNLLKKPADFLPVMGLSLRASGALSVLGRVARPVFTAFF